MSRAGRRLPDPLRAALASHPQPFGVSPLLALSRRRLAAPGLIAISSYSINARGFGSTTPHLDKTGVDALKTRPASPAVASAVASPVSQESQRALSEIAFAFEAQADQAVHGHARSIDGVLYQGQRAVQGAAEALRSLRRHDVRYVFLTNGGGKHETAKVKSLSQCLGISPDEDVIHNRVIQSHTPMRGWDDALKEQATVLITGANPDVARKVAADYGFKKVVTPADIIAASDKVYPFDGLRGSLHSQTQPLPDGKQVSSSIDPYGKDIPGNTLKIDQIFVWNDPRDWSLDIQVIYDLLVSHQGYYGTVSAKNGDRSLPNRGWQQDGQPELWMSNLDLFWKTEWPVNRYGTGAFLEALRGVWSASTGGAELRYEALGKPLRRTYDYAHDRLLHHAPDEAGGRGGRRRALRRVYMIGDNPESDVRGANEFRPEDGTEWVSILVRTGVWRQTAGEREPRHKPAVIVEDVADAIVWALQNEGVPATRAWLTSGGKGST